METILGITNGANRYDDLHIGSSLTQNVDRTKKIILTLLHRELTLLKESMRSFLTVVHNLASLSKDVHMVCSEREDSYTRCHIGAFHRVQDACRVIHHAERVDRCAEHLVLETAPNVVCKARAHEQHLLTGGYAERGSRYVYNCSKLHCSI